MEEERDLVSEVPPNHTRKEIDKYRSPICNFLRNNALLIATLTSVLLGIAIGMSCRSLNLTSDTIQFIGFPGEIFMRMFKMLLLPLIVSSMVTGLANLKGKSKGKLGLFTLLYYVCTTCIAITEAIILALAIRPGDITFTTTNDTTRSNKPLPTATDTFLDLIRNLLPPNIVQAAIQHSATVFTKVQGKEDRQSPDGEIHYLNISISNTSYPNSHEGNLTSVATLRFNTDRWKKKKSVAFNDGLNITVGIMFIIISKILSVSDLAIAVQQLGMYVITVLSGVAIHSLIVLPAIYFFLTRQNPFRVSLHMLQSLSIAVGTASSSAALPVTFHCCEKKLQFDKNICRFVLPIGTTINMDGLAIIQAMTPIFLAQISGKELMFGDILAISLSATLASIGTPGVPGMGFLTMLAVVVAAGLPTDDAYIVLSVDWFIQRMAAMLNVYGDSLAAGIFTHFFSTSRYIPREEHTAL